VPEDVDVRVDESGEEREPRQIVGNVPGCRADAGDAVAVDGDDRVSHGVPFSVEEASGANRDMCGRLGKGDNRAAAHGQCRDGETGHGAVW